MLLDIKTKILLIVFKHISKLLSFSNFFQESKTSNVGLSFERERVDSMLEKAGCLDLHYQVENCMVDHKDWRKCQDSLKKLKICIEDHHKSIHKN